MVFCSHSDGSSRSVSSGDVLGLEAQLGSMEEDSEVVAIDPQRPADLVLVALLEEQPLQELPLLGREGREDFPHRLTLFLGDDRFLRADARIPDLTAGIVAKR